MVIKYISDELSLIRYVYTTTSVSGNRLSIQDYIIHLNDSADYNTAIIRIKNIFPRALYGSLNLITATGHCSTTQEKDAANVTLVIVTMKCSLNQL